MNYEEAVEKINSFQRFGSRLGLERMVKLMELLGNPQDHLNVIHVGGTNGKGSVCRYLYSILQENGYKTGLYTSPYLERFTERIEFNGEEISHEDMISCTEEVLEKVNQMLREGFDSPTEFELITAIGFVYFYKKGIDYLVLEVGLGGTGDSTNIVKSPAVAVITSISYDHMEYLGDTLEKIAREKAGIIKNGVPLVMNAADKTAANTIKKIAEAKGCRILDATQFYYYILEASRDGFIFHSEIDGIKYSNLSISMLGIHQIRNSMCALAAIQILTETQGLLIDKPKLYEGLRKAFQNGRLEILKRGPYIIIDGAHNEGGAEALDDALKLHFPHCKILMVVGILADKKVDELVRKFSLITDDFVTTEPDSPRKFSAYELSERFKGAGKHCTAIPGIQETCNYVLNKSSTYDVIVFTGSLYLIGRVRGIMKNEK